MWAIPAKDTVVRGEARDQLGRGAGQGCGAQRGDDWDQGVQGAMKAAATQFENLVHSS